MDIHKNARLTLRSRERLVQQVIVQARTLKATAAAFQVTAKTAAKWVRAIGCRAARVSMIVLRDRIAVRAGCRMH